MSAPAFEPSRLTDQQLVAFMAFHRKKRTQGSPAALAAMEEHVRRSDKGFEIRKTVEVIREAAARREFIAYADLAKRSGLAWDKVRYRIFDHLAAVNEWGFRSLRATPTAAGPLPGAIVVAKEHLQDGVMVGPGLDNFISLAKRLGFDADGREEKREAFVAQEQQRVFAWAKGENP
jgi:hypothetical protein